MILYYTHVFLTDPGIILRLLSIAQILYELKTLFLVALVWFLKEKNSCSILLTF